jgi:hypothetical protein
VFRHFLVGTLRALLWAGAAAGVITAVVVARSAPEFRLGIHEIATWFGLFWVLSFVPCIVMELGVRHLLVEFGPDTNRRQDASQQSPQPPNHALQRTAPNEPESRR